MCHSTTLWNLPFKIKPFGRHCCHWTFAIQQNRSEPDWLQKYGRNKAGGLASSWQRRTNTALDRCLASLQAKHHRRHSWWVAQISLHMNLCKKTFWAFNLTAIMHMWFCISCWLTSWTLSNLCCCVKCSRISPITFFYISQGSAMTHLRCGGQCVVSFVANFLENTAVREFWKSNNICQSYERRCLVLVFLTHCVYN